MGSSIKWLRVESSANVNIEGGARLVRLVILDEDCADSVLELNDLVLALITIRSG